jgi:hypothetical protein
LLEIEQAIIVDLTNAKARARDVTIAINHEGGTIAYLHQGQPECGRNDRASGHFAHTLCQRGEQDVLLVDGYPRHRRHTAKVPLAPGQGLGLEPRLL